MTSSDLSSGRNLHGSAMVATRLVFLCLHVPGLGHGFDAILCYCGLCVCDWAFSVQAWSNKAATAPAVFEAE